MKAIGKEDGVKWDGKCRFAHVYLVEDQTVIIINEGTGVCLVE